MSCRKLPRLTTSTSRSVAESSQYSHSSNSELARKTRRHFVTRRAQMLSVSSSYTLSQVSSLSSPCDMAVSHCCPLSTITYDIAYNKLVSGKPVHDVMLSNQHILDIPCLLAPIIMKMDSVAYRNANRV